MIFKILLILISIMYPLNCFSHGTNGSISSGGIVIKAEFDDGTPMTYSETEIIAPDSDLPFSSGWTDRNGCFCFYPDIQGEYKVTIKDGMGHMLKIKVPVNKNMEPDSNMLDYTKSNSLFLRCQNIFIGLSIIFFIFGSILWWKGKKTLNKEKT